MPNQSTTAGPHIVLRPGTIRVEIETVPRLIAEALYPAEQVNGEPTVSYLTKVTPQRPLGDLLTDEDIQLLHSIWAKLPPYQDGMRASEWARYEAAFNGAKRRPAWTLLPVWINPNYNGEGGALMRAQAEAEHQVLLGNALVEGRITGITHAGAPVLNPFLGHGVYVSVRELERYLSPLPLPIAVRTGDPGEPAPPPRAIPVGRQNELAVLAAIRAVGYDPPALPPQVKGKRWAKAEARGKCALTDKQFKAAWERLLKAGEIAIKS